MAIANSKTPSTKLVNISTTDLFSALSNEIRLRCLMLMQLEGELCVCELTHALDLSQPMVSRHLAVLRDTGIVSDRRAGQWIYYRIRSELSSWATEIISITAHANYTAPVFLKDLTALKEMPNRPEAACCV